MIILFTNDDFQPTIKISTNLEVEMSTKTSEKTNPKKEETKLLATKSKVAPVEEAVAPKEPQTEKSHLEKAVPAHKLEAPEVKKPVTLVSLQKELESLRQTVQDHAQLITDLQSMLALKRRPTSNGKIQIRDKQTGKVYPSKNNCYQSLLRSGELKDLVDKGIFGPIPEKNNFGWFALVRALPDRFEEVKPEEKTDDSGKASGNDKPVPENQ